MKYLVYLIIQFQLGHLIAQKTDTLQLKNRFNTKNAYVHFYFDYDSLHIDSIPSREFDKNPLVQFNGYKTEIDSFLSSGTWIKFEELKHRFFIIEYDHQVIYAHEEYRDQFGKHFTKYEYDNTTGMKIYETFTEGGVGIQILEKNGETHISLDNEKVCVLKPSKRKRK